MFGELKYSFPSDFTSFTSHGKVISSTNGVPEETKSFAFPAPPVFQIRSGNFLINEQTVTERDCICHICNLKS